MYRQVLKQDDPRFNRVVSIYHHLGSYYFFRRSFAVYWNKFCIVYKENGSNQIFDTDEVTVVQYAKRIANKEYIQVINR